MIIGNNFNNPNQQANRFHSNFKRTQSQANPNNKTNAFVKNLSTFSHTDAANKDAMYDKTLALLNERLQNKQITMEEFKKQCEALGKRRNMN